MEDLEYLMYVDEEEEREEIHNSELKDAFENGVKAGKLKRVHGYNKRIIKNATRMGLSLEQISNLVNLPINEILVIQKEVNNNQN